MVGGRLPHILIAVMALLVALTGCATPGGADRTAGPGHEAPPDSGTMVKPEITTRAASPSLPQELNRLLTRAEGSLGLGNHAEALHDFALLTQLAPDSEQGREAAAEMARLSAGLRLEPAGQWRAADGSQLASSTRQLKSTGTPPPSVIATLSEGPARVAVHGLTIRFTVTEDGTSVQLLQIPTSELGTATASIQTDLLGIGAVMVSASPIVATERGEVELGTGPLVFVYDPSASVFAALTSTLVADRVEPAPELAKVMATRLRPIGSVAAQDGSVVIGFLEAYFGDPRAIAEILSANDAGYLCIAVLEIPTITRVEYQGRVYDIWKADGVVRFSLFDAVGGQSLISLSSEPIAGQGGSEIDALQDISRVGGEALESLLAGSVNEIRLLIDGSRG